MKALPSSTFWDTIPRVSQSFYEWYLSFRRKPQVYRLRGSEVTEGRYYFRMKVLSPSKKVSKSWLGDLWN